MEILHGLPKGMEEDAARLYWQAFGDKLGRLMGPEARAAGFFADTVHHPSIIAAIEGETLLGIAAYKRGQYGFSGAGITDFFRHYGISAIWRLVPLMLLDRAPAKGVLQMDGICVADTARGKGVGTALFAALFDHAKDQGYRAITLDVIDRNTRARALYEKLGFFEIETESTGPLRPLLGFARSAKMIREIG
jgi:ribosomal protein S18 acetylase RimI-like enzyme